MGPWFRKKAKRQRGRKKQQISEAESVSSQTTEAVILSLHSLNDAWWEHFMEERSRIDWEHHLRFMEQYRGLRRLKKKDYPVFQEKISMTAHIKDMDTVLKRSDVVLKMSSLGEELISAMLNLDDISPESLVTPDQKMAYQVKQTAVATLNKQYIELRDSLARTRMRYESPLQLEQILKNRTSSASQICPDYGEDETKLETDSAKEEFDEEE